MKRKLSMLAILAFAGFASGCASTINTGKLTFDVTYPGGAHHTEVPSFISTTTFDPVEFVQVAIERVGTLPLLGFLGG